VKTKWVIADLSQESFSEKEQRVDGSWFITHNTKFKVYSNGFREILSNQNPF